MKNGCWFDVAAGEKVCVFFEKYLKLSKGDWAGKHFELLKWQREDLLMPLFGWKKNNNKRRFRLAYIEIPKKNGKSAICSGLALYLAFADNEPGAEVYLAAADRKQAGIVYREAKSMVKMCPDILRFCKVIDSKGKIEMPSTNSFIETISSEAYTSEGLNIHGLIFDELHAQKNRELWDALRYGGISRKQPLLISITTAGWDVTSICFEQHEYARKIISGDIQDDAFFALIYGAEKDVDPLDEKVWERVNPSFGYTMEIDEFKQAGIEASQSPVKLNSFKRYRLNIWTEQAERWITADAWDKCSVVKDPIEWREKQLLDLKFNTCYAGLDLGSISDLTALVLFFPEHNICLPWFWVPESALQSKENVNRDLYRTWQDQKFLNVTPGNVCDYDSVRADINDVSEMFDMRELAVDRVFQGAQLCTQLIDDGHEVIAFGQGFVSMAAPCKEFEERILSNRFEHGNNPIMNWMASNVAVKTDDAGNMKPTKPKRNSPYKIDGIAAAVMALGRAMLEESEFDGEITII